MTRQLKISVITLTGLALLAGCGYFSGPQAKLKEAQKEFSRGDMPGAIKNIKAYLVRKPMDANGWLLLADAMTRQSNFAGAKNALSKATSHGASASAVMPRTLRLLQVQGNYPALQRALDADAKSIPPEILVRYRGTLALASRHPHRALRLFQQAHSLNSKDVAAVIGIASAQIALGNTKTGFSSLMSAAQAYPNEPRYRGALADLYMLTGKAQKAIPLYQAAIRAVTPHSNLPQWLGFEVGLAQADLQTQHYKAAGEAADKLERSASGLLVVRLLSARVAAAEHKYAQAAAIAEPIVAALPTEIEAHMLLAYATFSEGYKQQAESSLDAVISNHPSYIPARTFLAQIQLSQGRAMAARDTLAPVIGPNANASSLFLAGRIAGALGRDSEAQGLFARALAAPDASNSLRYQIGVIYLRTGHPRQATAALQGIQEGSSVAGKRDLLLALLSSSHKNAGDAALKKVAKKYATDTEMQREVAQTMAERGDIAGARKLLSSLLTKNPHDISTLLALASLEANTGQGDKARTLFSKVLALSPQSLPAYMGLAELDAQKGNTSQMLLDLKQARAADPKSLEPDLALVHYYLSQKGTPAQVSAALKAARAPMKAALALAPKKAGVLIVASNLALRSGDPAQALSIIKSGIAENARSVPLLLNLANLQAINKHFGHAKKALNQILTLQPGFLPAIRALALLAAHDHNFPEAIKIVQSARAVPGMKGQQAADQLAGALILEADINAARAVLDKPQAAQYLRAAFALYEKAYQAHPLARTGLDALQAGLTLKDQKAPEDLLDWLSKNPQDVAVRSLLDRYYEQTHQINKAIAILQDGVAINATNAEQLNNLAWLYQLKGDFRALSTAQQAYAAGGAQPAILDTLGWILVNHNKVQEGLPYLLKALQGQSHNPDIAYHYAYALVKAGQTPAAKKILESLLKTPGSFYSKKAVQALARSIGMPEA